MLVIGKIPDELRTANSEIVRYTKNRLEKLKTVKSLFLIHLREEGLIIKDQNNWMGNFLKTIPDYTASEEAIKEALKNLSIITSIIPSIKGIACWYDMLFVFLRDLLIKLNSKNKKYIFTPNRLLESIEIKHKEQIQNQIWKSISTSLKPVKVFQKLYFGENIVYSERIWQNDFYWRVGATQAKRCIKIFSFFMTS